MNDMTNNLTTSSDDSDLHSSNSIRRQLACSGSVFLWFAILLVLLFQPDILAALTLIPPWCWTVAGIVLAIAGFQRQAKRWSLLAIGLWILFSFVFVDEARGLLRMTARMWNSDRDVVQDEERIRVISFNCAADARSVGELLKHQPDLVLLQESPGREKLAELAEVLYGKSGSFVQHGDTSILAGGTLTDQTPADVSCFTQATVQLPGGRELDVVSLRLAPPVFRMDFWTHGFWSDHRDRRAEHREQVSKIVGQLQRRNIKRPLILGGDFNTTPVDSTLNQLRFHLFDTFLAAGRGLGNTGTNDYPLFRVDQIWASRGIDAISSTTQQSEYSDHRMVISDVRLPNKPAEPSRSAFSEP